MRPSVRFLDDELIERIISEGRDLICNLGVEIGVVARFDSGAIWAVFPPLCSRHHGVGLWPAKLGHPVEDVTPDHGLSLLRVAVPRLQAASEH